MTFDLISLKYFAMVKFSTMMQINRASILMKLKKQPFRDVFISCLSKFQQIFE